MQRSYSTIISAADLELNFDSVHLIDCRADLVSDRYGFEAFNRGRIPGAKFVDLNRDLSGEPGLRGRHPLPDRNNWLETVRNLGIRNNDQIVAYDDVGGMYAARFWWMMRWLGHENVALLDGGIQQWERKLESGENPARPTKSYYSSSKMLTQLIEIDELTELLLQNENSKVISLIDARPRERFAGLNEPIDKAAGHIPGATCLPFQENLDPDLRFKKAAKLRARFEEIYGDRIPERVCYCGSGVSACHNILAANIAGLGELALFAGSWSEWIEDSSRPIETDC